MSIVDGRYVMMIESREGTKWASSKYGISWQDRGLLVAKDRATSPHGHVTPFLFSYANKHLLYFGTARSEHWNQNSIMHVAISLFFIGKCKREITTRCRGAGIVAGF